MRGAGPRRGRHGEIGGPAAVSAEHAQQRGGARERKSARGTAGSCSANEGLASEACESMHAGTKIAIKAIQLGQRWRHRRALRRAGGASQRSAMTRGRRCARTSEGGRVSRRENDFAATLHGDRSLRLRFERRRRAPSISCARRHPSPILPHPPLTFDSLDFGPEPHTWICVCAAFGTRFPGAEPAGSFLGPGRALDPRSV